MIELKDVSFSYYKGAKALNNISLNIKKGELILLLGESGSGKTSLARTINCLVPKFFDGDFKGEVNILGKPTKNLSMVDLSSMIGTVFQNPRNQFFTLDTTSELAFNLENHGINPELIKSRVFDIFNDLNINHLKDKDVYKLSGGQMQMVAIASACALNPEILVLDEPSANLDRSSISDLIELLKIFKSNKTTVIISEHRLYYLKDLVDRAFYIKDGEIKNIFKGYELYSMNDRKRLEYGLRSLNDDSILIKNKPSEKDENLLEFKNLSVGYKKPLISKMNMKIESGEVLGIIGENGSGKSTLLNTISGLIKEISGEILFNGKKLNRRDRQKLCALVMQEPSYQFFMESVEKELTFGIKNYDENKLNMYLQDMNLKNIKDNDPLKLSGGEKQRLAILINLLDNKDVFLLDEPSSGLDYKNMLVISDEIKKLQEKGKIIIIISHDYELLSEVCTKIIYYNQGGFVKMT